MPGQEPGKIQITSIEVDSSKSYRSITVTDGYTNRKARVNGDWTASWKVGDIIDIIWIPNEYPAGSGKISYKLWEPKADSKKPQSSSDAPASRASASGEMSIDEKKTNAWLIASTAFSGKFESVEDLVKMARQVYSALYNSTAAPKKSSAPAAQAVAPAPVQPPLPMPEPAPKPAELPVDFDTVEEDFEEDPETPF